MAEEYRLFKRRIYQKLGIDLSLYKEAQMKRRLTSLRNKRGYSSFATYYKALEQDENLLNEFVDRITINVSEFYRNPKRWDVLQNKVLPELLAENKSIFIWSAACSTGEEPYSLAMMLQEYFPEVQARILATDIDEKAIKIAKQGIYQQRALKDLPPHMKSKYFSTVDGLYHLDETIKQKVSFKAHNLLSDPYPSKVDLIVCRNVLIYFTDEAKEMIYEKFNQALREKGVLFVGSTEQIFQPQKFNFQVMETFFYQKISH